MIDIKPEKYEEFKKFMAKKLSHETGRKFLPSDIFVGNSSLSEIILDKYKCIFANMSELSSFDNLKNLEFIWGDIMFFTRDINRLSKLKFIEGQLLFSNKKVKTFKSLEYVKELVFLSCDVESLGSIKKIKENLKVVGSLGDFGSLEYVGGDVILIEARAKSLNNIEYIGGDLYLDYEGYPCDIQDLGNLKYVGGKVFLNDKQKEMFKDKIIERNGECYFRNEESFAYEDLSL